MTTYIVKFHFEFGRGGVPLEVTEINGNRALPSLDWAKTHEFPKQDETWEVTIQSINSLGTYFLLPIEKKGKS